MLLKTSTITAPWTVVEGNDKWYARVKTLKTIVDAVSRELEYEFPESAGKGKKKNARAEKDNEIMRRRPRWVPRTKARKSSRRNPRRTRKKAIRSSSLYPKQEAEVGDKKKDRKKGKKKDKKKNEKKGKK